MIGGISIDLMRFERDRTELQSTLDRAVLGEVMAPQGLNFRSVSAKATGDFDTQFMHMGGVDTLEVGAASAAEERIDGGEISLVMDVSGSMNNNSKLTDLKVAATDFVTEMFKNTEEDKLTI